MKKTLIMLLICCCLGAALAEAVPTTSPLEKSAGSLMDGLGQTWSALTNMAGEAGKVASEWLSSTDFEKIMEDVGNAATKWLSEDAPKLIETGTQAISKWIDSGEAKKFGTEAVARIEAAWKTLTEGASENSGLSKEDLVSAYNTLKTWLTESSAAQEVVNAVEGLAKAAGLDTAATNDIPE